ncbi:MAG: hypothetical protein KKF48_03535 [Nanoarchaeota archaeon]|nr:hypothetical protein [Nanoarchaeota archaeon]MBU1028092.1 hypothetical protein [Nanoarchaeota archaeon]
MINKKSLKKKGVSPVIATVLLIAMVMIIALIIFLWFKNMLGEEATKFGKNVKLVCDDVEFEASYDGSSLYVSNLGNVPIFNIKLEIFAPGSHYTEDLNELSDKWKNGLRQGGVFSGPIGDIGNPEKIILIPVLVGSTDKGEKTFVCEERHGYEIYF